MAFRIGKPLPNIETGDCQKAPSYAEKSRNQPCQQTQANETPGNPIIDPDRCLAWDGARAQHRRAGCNHHQGEEKKQSVILDQLAEG